MNTKLKPRLVASYDIPAWKRSGAILKEKIQEKWVRKEKYKQEKKEASYKKQKQVSNEGNTHNKQSI